MNLGTSPAREPLTSSWDGVGPVSVLADSESASDAPFLLNPHTHSRLKHVTRSYNKERYIGAKKLTSFIRQFISIDIFERIKKNGFLGQIAGACGDKLTEKPLSKASYKLAGVFYDKNTDDPVKGSILFELWHMVLSILAKLCVGFRLK